MSPMNQERMIFLPTEPKPKFRPLQNDLGEREIFEKMALSGVFALVATMVACHWREAAGPALIYCAESFRRFRQLENLEKLKPLAASIRNLDKPEMSEAGKQRALEQMEEAMKEKFGE